MICPECGSPDIRGGYDCAVEPHGESHEDVFLVCVNGHRFDESDALDDELAPLDVLALRTALAEMQPAAELTGDVKLRREWR